MKDNAGHTATPDQSKDSTSHAATSEDELMSKAFFEKAMFSLKQAIIHISHAEKDQHYSSLVVREIAHAYELLLKSSIALHSRFLLYDLKEHSLVYGDEWKSVPLDELYTRPTENLHKLLFGISKRSSFEFLRESHQLIEDIRVNRNKVEHSNIQMQSVFISQKIAPFFHSVIKILMELNPNYGGAIGHYLREDDMKILNASLPSKKDRRKLVPCSSFPKETTCISCVAKFAYVTEDDDEMYCLVCCDFHAVDRIVCSACKRQSRVFDQYHQNFKCCHCGRVDSAGLQCPICSCPMEQVKSDMFKCFGDCEGQIWDFSGSNLNSDNSKSTDCSSCNSYQTISLGKYTGDDEGFCFSCNSAFPMWRCESCSCYQTGDKYPPPEENPVDLCEDCGPEYVEAYNDIH